ncbi:hypothetical protein L7F22_038853 [Adiantum nelumboides]|nr:hypothetical protein [Adiantum nelumboides]
MRAETFEIRWHDTQPIFSCSFQPISAAHLRRVLEHNRAQAAGLEPGKVLPDSDQAGPSKTNATSISSASGPSSISATAATINGTPQSKLSSIPLSAQGQSWRFATAGGDNHARIWMVHPNIPSPAALAAAAQVSGTISKHPPRVEYRATLRRHSGVVNCVRFSPREDLLATTGDDGMVLFWIPSDGPPSTFGSTFDEDGDAEFAKEHWRLRTMCRASPSEIYDMAWSPSGDAVVVGGTDFVARIINANDGTVIREISEHNHYIQGVTWDPLSEYIATQSSDRSVHVHQLQGRGVHELTGTQLVSRNTKMDLTHRRNASNNGNFIWDHMSRPSAKRRASSHASDSERDSQSTHAAPAGRSTIGKRTQRSSTPLEIVAPNAASSSAATLNNANAIAQTPSSASSNSGQNPRAATPTQNQSPAPVHPHSMNPPQRTPSRRSSFSGSQIGSPPTSATSLAPSYPPSLINNAQFASGSTPVKAVPERPGSSASRSASRNPPPLPAIRAPPSPKQRMAALHASSAGSMARLGMRLYGDESFSGFFRRLSFSPDGALLVTPTGIFESTSAPAGSTNVMQSPASPTVASLGREAVSPGSPLLPNHPAAQHPSGPPGPPRSTVYLYARGNLHKSNAPIAHLPGHKTATLVVKFSPILYELRRGGSASRTNSEEDGIAPHPTIPLEAGKQKTVALSSAASAAGGVASSASVSGTNDVPNAEETIESGDANTTPKQSNASAPPASMIGLPYRMVFAVATHDSVWIYDTQQGGPLCCFSNMHYASFTDLTWSPDGQTLMMCSTDGYCSIVVFDYGELGQPYTYASQPSLQQPVAPIPPAKLSGSPMLRRASAQSLPGSTNPIVGSHGTPPSAPGQVGGSGNLATSGLGNGLSPSLGLGLATGNGLDGESKTMREIDPPVVPASAIGSIPASVGTLESNAGGISNEGSTSNDTTRKKRRIAPTLEGPIGS